MHGCLCGDHLRRGLLLRGCMMLLVLLLVLLLLLGGGVWVKVALISR